MKIWTLLGIGIGFSLLSLLFTETVPQENQENVLYSVSQHWKLPSELDEISGMAWLDGDRIAAVQDEEGIIYIYNLKNKKIDKEIAFGKPGDYEGITTNKEDAYVLRSDGTIFEISNFEQSTRTVKTFKTPFSDKNNMETIAIDIQANTLLLIPKDRDLESDTYKGIYGFSLRTKKFQNDPLFKIDLGNPVLKKYRENNRYKTFRPSDMAMHPKTNEMYILDGAKPKLLILDTNGTIKKIYRLDKKLFPQPEGITFSPDGRLFISSEAKKNGNGSITELKLKD